MLTDRQLSGHIDWIARQAYRFHRRRDDAADLAQETLCRIWANRDKYDSRHDFKPWALTVMTNIFCTQHERRSRSPMADRADYPEARCPDYADDPVTIADMLSVVHRSASECVGVECVMLYADGYTYDEIARMVGVGIGTVKSRIAAGRRLLARRLGRATS